MRGSCFMANLIAKGMIHDKLLFETASQFITDGSWVVPIKGAQWMANGGELPVIHTITNWPTGQHPPIFLCLLLTMLVGCSHSHDLSVYRYPYCSWSNTAELRLGATNSTQAAMRHSESCCQSGAPLQARLRSCNQWLGHPETQHFEAQGTICVKQSFQGGVLVPPGSVSKGSPRVNMADGGRQCTSKDGSIPRWSV